MPNRYADMMHVVTMRDAAPKLYYVWKGIRARCYSPAATSYRYYGGKGIRLSNEWNDWENFFTDMANDYEPGLSLDRIDADKDYSKDNCRWVTKGEQSRNRPSFNRNITIDGESKTMSEWCRHYGITRQGFYGRVRRGMSEVDALTTPRMPGGPKKKKTTITLMTIQEARGMLDKWEAGGNEYVRLGLGVHSADPKQL